MVLYVDQGVVIYVQAVAPIIVKVVVLLLVLGVKGQIMIILVAYHVLDNVQDVKGQHLLPNSILVLHVILHVWELAVEQNLLHFVMVVE